MRRAVRRPDRHRGNHPRVVPRRALLRKQAVPMESQKISANSVKVEMQGNVSSQQASNLNCCGFDRRQTDTAMRRGRLILQTTKI